MSINTPAIVLRRNDLFTVDSSLRLYTKQLGKVDVFAKGLQKSTSKLAGHAKPLTATEVFLVRGRTRFVFAGSLGIDRFAEIHGDIDRLWSAGMLAKLIDLMTPIEQADRGIYELFVSALRLINGVSLKHEQSHLLPYVFAWKLLVASGYEAELQLCVICHRSVKEIQLQVALQARQGGLVHRQTCLSTWSGKSVLMSKAAISGLRYLVNAPIDDVARLAVNEQAFAEIEQGVKLLIEERFEVGRQSNFWRLKVDT